MHNFGFDHILGNETASKYLCNLSLSEDVPQSIIITGEEGVGKLQLAEQFALSLLCENKTPKGPCGLCNNCQTYAQKHNPNIAYWYPKGQNTTIDQMRALKELSMYPPIKAKYKINIIQKGDTLNEEASNSILKIIEEPPTYLINILIYSNPHNILQTIRSRSIVINLSPINKDVIKSYLSKNHNLDQSFLTFAISYSMGSIGKALILAENEKRDDLRQITFDCVKSIITKPMDLLYLADILSNKDNYFSKTGKITKEEIKADPKLFYSYPIICEITSQEGVLFALDMISLIFRDMLVLKTSESKELINIDKKDEIKTFSDKLTEEKIIKAINIIWKTKDKLKANVNTAISLQAMLCRLLFELKK
ncbi:MAG: hypothetical protein IJS60_11145 [Abditibacteriota bacterium]|nr:hypothetical protein [Abditibacteriota bacterium]